MSDSGSETSGWVGPRPLHNPIGVARLGQIYSRTAAFYDSLVADKQAAPKLAALEALHRRPGERLLEVGVGTGWAFGQILDASGPERAFGLDVAAGMLEVARARLRSEHDVTAASLLLGDARKLPFADGSMDCLLITYTFEVLPESDIPPAIAEALRVLRPGGRAVAVNLTDGEGDEAAMILDWKARYEVDPEFFGGARPLQLAPMLAAHGFERAGRSYVGPDWPSEVLLAYKPVS